MADNVYDFIGTKNARLAKFCDNNPNISLVMMKLVVHLENIARERGRVLDQETYDCFGSPDGKMFVIKIRS